MIVVVDWLEKLRKNAEKAKIREEKEKEKKQMEEIERKNRKLNEEIRKEKKKIRKRNLLYNIIVLEVFHEKNFIKLVIIIFSYKLWWN